MNTNIASISKEKFQNYITEDRMMQLPSGKKSISVMFTQGNEAEKVYSKAT
jgi:hypothetical protein